MYSILLSDTSTCSKGSQGIERVTLQLLDDPKYLFSLSQPNIYLISGKLRLAPARWAYVPTRHSGG